MEFLSLVIGLEDRYRGSQLELDLRSHGLIAERIPGVLVHDLPAAIDSYVDQETAKILLRRTLTYGEIGCALAHRDAYASFLGSSAELALIFEDDARVIGALPLQAIAALLDTPAPRIVLLDWNPGWTIVNGTEVFDGSSLYRAMFAPIDARGYAANRAAADILLQNSARVNYVADWPAQVASLIEFYILYPRPVRADEDSTSTLESDRQSQELQQAEPKLTKALRMVETATHIRWLRHKHAYGSYRAYLHHEVLRLPTYAVARKLNQRVYPGDPSSPLTISLSRPRRRNRL